MTRLSIPLAAALFLAPIAAEATIARAVQFDDKVEAAAAIVVGKVVAQDSRWDAKREWILTTTTFQVEKTLKGSQTQQISIVTPGGVVGTIAQEVVGVPKFRQGEEHVVFVRNTQSGPTVLYLEQGDYHVAKDDRGNRIVTPGVTSSVLVDTGRGTAVSPESPRTLREFEGAVRDTIRRREVMKMELVQRQKREEASLRNQLQRNWPLVTLALIGALLASWQLYKRW
jgi:hypothetical protein